MSDFEPDSFEKRVLRRDKRFLFRLIFALAITAVAGGFIVTQMTSHRTAGCAARMFS